MRIDARELLDELQRAWNDQCRERNNGDPDPWIRKSYTTIEAQSATIERMREALTKLRAVIGNLPPPSDPSLRAWIMDAMKLADGVLVAEKLK